MASIVIRDLDENTILRLDALAKDKNMSREKFLRQALYNLSVAGEVAAVENKYSNIMNQLLEMLQVTTNCLERNSDVLENFELREGDYESRY